MAEPRAEGVVAPTRYTGPQPSYHCGGAKKNGKVSSPIWPLSGTDSVLAELLELTLPKKDSSEIREWACKKAKKSLDGESSVQYRAVALAVTGREQSLAGEMLR